MRIGYELVIIISYPTSASGIIVLLYKKHPQNIENFFKQTISYSGLLIFRAVTDPRNSDISAKSRKIPPKNAKYRKIRQKYFQILVGKTYLILILAIRPVLFTPNVQIYLETSSLQRVNNVLKLPSVLRLMLRKTGH